MTQSLEQNLHLAKNDKQKHSLKRIIHGRVYFVNCKFTKWLILSLFALVLVTWLAILLITAGDVHTHPGPLSTSSSTRTFETDSSRRSTQSAFNFANLSNHLSIVHYNVQSIASKLEILGTELFEFDILAFTETWLNPSIPTDDLLLQSYRIPERKDRAADNHGWVMLYVKEALFYRRRNDMEPQNVECIWIELNLKHNRVLVGFFFIDHQTQVLIITRPLKMQLT